MMHHHWLLNIQCLSMGKSCRTSFKLGLIYLCWQTNKTLKTQLCLSLKNYIYIYTHIYIYIWSLEFRVTSLAWCQVTVLLQACLRLNPSLLWQDVQMSSNGLIVIAPDSTTFRKGNGLR